MSSREINLFIACSNKAEEFIHHLKNKLESQNENISSINCIILDSNISWEKIAKKADKCIGAIVIASNDEELESSSKGYFPNAYRASDNTCLELGWLLARFGSSRVTILKHANVQLPERLSGISRITYDATSVEERLEEAACVISNWITETKFSKKSFSEVPEVLFVSHADRTHYEHWENMRRGATKDLVITGISMGNIQRNIENVFSETIGRSTELKVKFIVLDPRYAKFHEEMLDAAHRQNAVEDNRSFFECLYQAWLELETSQQERVSLYLLNGFIPAFAAHVADGEEPGGLILLQILMPKKSSILSGITDYPRILLIRRSGDGAFTRVLKSIQVIESKSQKFDIYSIPQLLETIC